MTDRFKQGFHEEARELLVELEASLLELDQKRDDPEIVGRAFRALHTIKGSGAMFGFDDIAAFAHKLEAVFDQLRKGQLAATTDLINLSLAAGDQIKTMLDAAAGVGATDPNRCTQLLAELRTLTGSPESQRDAEALGGPDRRHRLGPVRGVADPLSTRSGLVVERRQSSAPSARTA